MSEQAENQTTSLRNIVEERFPGALLGVQPTADRVPTLWVKPEVAASALAVLKRDVEQPFTMLYDLSALDERSRAHRVGPCQSEFTLVYHLLSFERNSDVRIKVPLSGEHPRADTITKLWANADWYEREAWDMFGIRFTGHPNLRRILMPPWWEGHPLRKEHPARSTDMGPFRLREEELEADGEMLRFEPQQWGLEPAEEDEETLFLNIGPQHPGTHGPWRLVLRLHGETITDVVPDIGFHHRGAEKMGERQSWHTYIPYTDRVDYLGGTMNNLPYVMAVEQLAGIDVPDRAKLIRVMTCELFRISSHLVWYGTLAQDLGALSPVFYMFTDRERVLEIIEAICGARMHPNWFRIGGVAQDLPKGWEGLLEDFLAYMPGRMDEYDRMVMKNSIFRRRTCGVGAYTREEAIEWGVTGPGLRACGFEWDFRKRRPYSGYDQLEFDIPTAEGGDCYARAEVRVAEIRQSLRIIRQCVENMPAGDHKARHPLAVPPLREETMTDIETLIDHFLGVSWGPPIPVGEGFVGIEGTKGNNGYYLVSDGGVQPYRVRIRTPSFPHLQMVPHIIRGSMVPDLLALLGSIDFVLADVDR